MKQTITIQAPTPHGPKQALLMSAFRLEHVREVFGVCGTKFGKSLSGGAAMTSAVAQHRGAHGRWVAPIGGQATAIGMEYCEPLLPPPPHSHVSQGSPKRPRPHILMPFTKSVIEFWHGNDPVSLEGAGVDYYVFDEAAKLDAQVRASARTTMTATNGRALYLCYPWGGGWFKAAAFEARDHMNWAIKNNVPPERLFVRARTIDNPRIDPRVVAEAKRTMPWRLFRQYFLAEFVDDSTVFGGWKSCLQGLDLSHIEGDNQQWYAHDAAERTVATGADWAKTKDWTVFIAFDVETRQIVGFQRFHRTAYPEAVRRLVLFSRRFKETLAVNHDATGVGSAIDDMLANTDLPYNGIVFSNPRKAELVAKFITSIEHGWVGLPHWPELVGEFDSYEVVVQASGALVYNAAQGKHDDIVTACFLAHEALQENYLGGEQPEDGGPKPPKKLTGKEAEEQAEAVSAGEPDPIEAFYAELREDAEDEDDGY